MKQILLTTPLTTGSLGGSDYTHVNISECVRSSDANTISFNVIYGYLQAGVWVTGPSQPDGYPKRYVLRDITGQVDSEGNPIPDVTDYTDTIAGLPTDANEKIHDGEDRLLLQWLLDNSYYLGTLV